MRNYARIAVVCVLGLGTSMGAWAWAEEPSGAAPPTATSMVVEGERAVFLAQGDPGPSARTEVPAEIMVLHATNTGAGIDEELKHLSQLRKPPFSAYDTYRLVHSEPLRLKLQDPKMTRLPNGRDLRTVLKEVLPEDRYRVAASISRPQSGKDKKRSYLPLLEVTAKSGEAFFVAGQSFRGGILVVGIRVGEEGKKAPDPPPKK